MYLELTIKWLTQLSLSLAGISTPSSRSSFFSMPNPSAPSGQLDTSLLEERCRFFLVQGLAESTQKSYASGQRRFYNFCLQAGKLHPTGSPCPTDEWTLCLFVAFLADSIQHSSIKVYLSAVRSLHIEQGFLLWISSFCRIYCAQLSQLHTGYPPVRRWFSSGLQQLSHLLACSNQGFQNWPISQGCPCAYWKGKGSLVRSPCYAGLSLHAGQCTWSLVPAQEWAASVSSSPDQPA